MEMLRYEIITYVLNLLIAKVYFRNIYIFLAFLTFIINLK